MIYLIKSAAYKNKECTEYEDTLKIGYTKDGSKKGRFECYITENPTSQILYLIPEGDERDEKNLHHHFRKYKKDYGQEWFSYEQEILDFFDTHTTKESLRELNYLRKDLRELIEVVYFDKILLSLVQSPRVYFNTKAALYSNLDSILITVDDFDSYFRSQYPNVQFDSESPIISMDNKDFGFLESFKQEFNLDNNFTRRMKMYVELVSKFPEIYTLNIKIFQSIIPPEYQGYMNLLGPERIKANKYIEADMKREADYLLKANEIRGYMIMTFKEGNRYTSKYIKEKLGEIYSNLNIEKTPKASELVNYFDIKECLISNGTKRDRGFEIIKVKEETQCQ